MGRSVMWVTLMAAAFLFFAEPLVEMGLDWRTAVYAASVWLTGGPA